jgi:hypothetical protein
MSQANRFGTIIGPRDVEAAVNATLEIWMDDYLGEIERLYGYTPDSIERPRGYLNSSQWHKWPEDQLPVIVTVNAGLSGQPVRRANGVYDVAWLVGIAPIVSDTNQDSTRELAQAYTVAVRTALLQHKMLKSSLYPDGLANFTTWHDETYSDMPALQTRSMDSGRVVLEIGVEGALTEQTGPRTPATPASADPGPWPTVAEDGVTVTTVPLNPTEAVS